ncbi:amino acid ABC transporter permease [Pseudaminobacter arsenicus]|uniref:Glutamate/aspartate import permease protein GltK n=1 Tax=Borborobacter arsenicus TaxID=1851146 RepID=A0A432V7F6_9HYPH|nr:amino acid ABC transporter permease [Pseudaminobacter arsenicus]RUM98106.1 amino acid ABC transporter permease [Pseudaminobacter arsenicus]
MSVLEITTQAGSRDSQDLPTIVPLRHWGRYVSGALLACALIFLGIIVSRSQQIVWAAIPEYLFNPAILKGIVVTLQLTFGAMLIGIALGTVLATMRMSHNPVFVVISGIYIWLFRGTPLLVQIFFWFNIALFIPMIEVGPYLISTNSLITASVAGLLALSLHEAANMAEIVRGGLLSVDSGQGEASQALGLTRAQAMRRIILPQAIRVIIPPTGNQAIGMLKASAMVSVIGMQDLLTQAQNTSARNFLVIELLCVAAIWYLVLTTVATIGQYYLESYFQKGVASSGAKSLSSRIAAGLRLPIGRGSADRL